ncbi:MAG: 16S rRNA processing protein RimM [uncultured Friedmanniella sp.]|uniref:Ribosome maturation factor RimM n=1 Tax=uncultured Friedmanniella sp. TaxID=335381 RepID=A0A6J4KMB4_9ACTN|nr:ribosome maturation factor RimM [uncultured Friedmanniella sp.]CAA9309955.1 MAG: 16S rRNA processing protein RimM [uncultured Friedmanniella sp.]
MAETVEVVVGVIGRAHGIRGDVTIDVRTDEPERRFAVGEILRAEEGRRTFTVTSARDHSGRLLVHFEQLPDRTVAEAARGTVLVADVDPTERPEDEEEFYDRQLIGLSVLAADGSAVGTVTDVLHLPLQDTLEVDTPDGVRLVPFVAAVVPRVDLNAGELQLADLPGLLTETDEGDDEGESDPA